MHYSSISSSSAGEKCLSDPYFDLYSALIIDWCSEEGCVLVMDEVVATSGNMLAQNDGDQKIRFLYLEENNEGA